MLTRQSPSHARSPISRKMASPSRKCCSARATWRVSCGSRRCWRGRCPRGAGAREPGRARAPRRGRGAPRLRRRLRRTPRRAPRRPRAAPSDRAPAGQLQRLARPCLAESERAALGRDERQLPQRLRLRAQRHVRPALSIADRSTPSASFILPRRVRHEPASTRAASVRVASPSLAARSAASPAAASARSISPRPRWQCARSRSAPMRRASSPSGRAIARPSTSLASRTGRGARRAYL